jgi:hypothetical protein
MNGAVDRTDVNLLRNETFDGNVSQATLVNGPTYVARTNQLKFDVGGGRIMWGDGSGYGNTGLTGIGADGGGNDDQLQGTANNDIVFGDGSGGGKVQYSDKGKAGGGDDVLLGGAGDDLVFGDGFNCVSTVQVGDDLKLYMDTSGQASSASANAFYINLVNYFSNNTATDYFLARLSSGNSAVIG